MILNVINNTQQQNPCVTYDITVPEASIACDKTLAGEPNSDEYKASQIILWSEKAKILIGKLKTFCKAYAFQLECGSSGTNYYHFQGRIKLMVKARINNVIKFCHDNDIKGHISLTSTENSKNNFYVTKDDTRICGPWKDNDPVDLPMPWQLAIFPTKLPFQISVIEKISIRELRVINCIIDPIGCKGKSTLMMMLLWSKLGQYLPYSDNHKDLMQAAFDLGEKPGYVFDLPRSLPKKHMKSFFAAIEDIKNGIFFDFRYHFKCELRNAPNIWIFSNKWPDQKMLSKGRWLFWQITETSTLELYSQSDIDIAQNHINEKKKRDKQRNNYHH